MLRVFSNKFLIVILLGMNVLGWQVPLLCNVSTISC